MKDAISAILGVTFVISGFFFGIGLIDARIAEAKCQTEMARIEYAIPTYRIGCWLGTSPN
jgi:hypothetical protein